MKDSELASLFGKLKYEENLIDNIYETKKNKSRISTPPLSTAFISTSIVQVFQDSPDDEEDTRSCLAVQKKLTKLNAINVARKHKPELRPTKDFEAKYNKVKAKMALLSLSALASKAITVKNKAEENDAVSKEGARNGEWVKISVRKVHTLLEMEDNDDRKIDVSDVASLLSNKPRLSEAEDSTLPNHDIGKVPSDESQRNTTDPLVVVSDSSATNFDLADESSVCSTPLPPLEKLAGAKLVSGPKTIKSILKSNSTFKAKTLKSITLKEPSSAPAKDNKKRNDHRTCDHAEFMSSMKTTHHLIDQGESSSRSRPSRPAIPFPSCINCGFISLRRGIKPRNPQHVTKNYETCGSNVHTTTDHNDIEWFRKREALQAKKARVNKTVSSNV
ncbi:hypothetical protein Tco_0794104 [Tanacetum coccineum]